MVAKPLFEKDIAVDDNLKLAALPSVGSVISCSSVEGHYYRD